MTRTSKALIWAAIIILAALVASYMNLSDNASLGLITGLTGAAWGSVYSGNTCHRNCLV